MNNKFETGLTACCTAYTKYGAVINVSTGSKCRDLFAFGGAYRHRNSKDKINLFMDAYHEDKSNAMKCLFYLRDIRNGQGERAFFRTCYSWVATVDPTTAIEYLKYIPEYGRWDDMLCVIYTDAEDAAVELIRQQLKTDIASMNNNSKISLLAKWMPSENASSFHTTLMAYHLRKKLGLTARKYRKMLSSLRKYLNIVERQMSNNEWGSIKYQHVPSCASMKYSSAFSAHDIQRYSEYVKSGLTMHAEAMYPYEIVRRAMRNTKNRTVLNKAWDSVYDTIDQIHFDGIVVADTSESMFDNNMVPISTAISAALLMAEKSVGPYHGKVITFSDKPTTVQISDYSTLVKNVNMMRGVIRRGHANIEAVFNMVLDIAISSKCSANELPKSIVIVSDMNFDRGQEHELLFDTISRRFAIHGYKMPHIIFWNVNPRNNIIPTNKGNVSFVSGSSLSSNFDNLSIVEKLDTLLFEEVLSKYVVN